MYITKEDFESEEIKKDLQHLELKMPNTYKLLIENALDEENYEFLHLMKINKVK